MSRLSANSPWTTDDLTRAFTFTFLGLTGLAICWYGISGEANYRDQVPWVVGAVGALAVSGFGILRWLLAGMRSVHREMHSVTDTVRTQVLHQVPVSLADEFDLPAEKSAQPRMRVDVYVTGAGMTRVHRPDCLLVAGRTVEIVNQSEIDQRGLAYCGVCTS